VLESKEVGRVLPPVFRERAEHEAEAANRRVSGNAENLALLGADLFGDSECIEDVRDLSGGGIASRDREDTKTAC
jgi:hypothetical protein